MWEGSAGNQTANREKVGNGAVVHRARGNNQMVPVSQEIWTKA